MTPVLSPTRQTQPGLSLWIGKMSTGADYRSLGKKWLVLCNSRPCCKNLDGMKKWMSPHAK